MPFFLIFYICCLLALGDSKHPIGYFFLTLVAPVLIFPLILLLAILSGSSD